MGVSLGVVDSDIDWNHIRDLLNDRGNVVNHNLTVLVSLEKQELASLSIIMSVDSCNRDFLLDTHVVKLTDQLLVALMRLERRR